MDLDKKDNLNIQKEFGSFSNKQPRNERDDLIDQIETENAENK